MRSNRFEINPHVLARSAVIVLICGISAGCSSNATRFNGGLDGIFTASSGSQRDVGTSQAVQIAENVQTAPVDTVSRGSLAPAVVASSGSLPPVQQAASVAQAAPVSLAEVRSNSVAMAESVEAGISTNHVPAPRFLGANERTASSLTDAGRAVAGSVADAGGYTVQAGDTISAIAQKTGVSTAALKSANGLNDGLIRVGQKLTIPAKAVQVASVGQSAANVVSANSVPANVVSTSSVVAPEKAPEQVNGYTPPKKDEKVIEDAEKQAAIAPDSTGIGRLRWPVRGRVISGYGANSGSKTNDGIDISVPEGTSVKAAENGVVIYAGDGLKEFGNTVLVRHEDGLVTVYGHASKLKVTRGEKVKRGQEIALSGTSGSANAPKLHFEVRKNSAPVDPSKFLE